MQREAGQIATRLLLPAGELAWILVGLLGDADALSRAGGLPAPTSLRRRLRTSTGARQKVLQHGEMGKNRLNCWEDHAGFAAGSDRLLQQVVGRGRCRRF